MPGKGQIHSGMLLVVFAVNESQNKRTRPPYHRRGAGRQHQILNLENRHGAVAPTLTDRGKPSTTPSDKQQHRSSSGGGGGGGGDGPAK